MAIRKQTRSYFGTGKRLAKTEFAVNGKLATVKLVVVILRNRFPSSQEKIHFPSRMIRDRCVGSDSLRAQTNRFCAPPRRSISLFSFPRVEAGKESSSHGSLVENGRLDQSRLRLTSVWEKEGRDIWTPKLRSA